MGHSLLKHPKLFGSIRVLTRHLCLGGCNLLGDARNVVGVLFLAGLHLLGGLLQVGKVMRHGLEHLCQLWQGSGWWDRIA